MKIALCTIVLNEEEFVQDHYRINSQLADTVIYVHGSVPTYAQANPDLVDSDGLSTDRTAELISDLMDDDPNVLLWTMYPAAFRDYDNPAQEKCILRECYLKALHESLDSDPDWILTLDADEFIHPDHHAQLRAILKSMPPEVLSVQIPFVHWWRPPSVPDWPRSKKSVRGAYAGIPHIRIFRYFPPMTYIPEGIAQQNHNYPQYRLRDIWIPGSRFRKHLSSPVIQHYGFTRQKIRRVADTNYYVERGEGILDGRQPHIDFRRAWETWRPDDELPHGGEVIGPPPEISPILA